MTHKYNFEKLEVWQDSRSLVKLVYSYTEKFPSKENYGLSLQMRRAAISVSSNIAEGMGRVSDKEQIHFLEISYGSLMETYCQLFLALDLGYISQENIEKAKLIVDEIANKLNALSRSIKRRLE